MIRQADPVAGLERAAILHPAAQLGLLGADRADGIGDERRVGLLLGADLLHDDH